MRLCGARSRLRGNDRHTADAPAVEALWVHHPPDLSFARIPFKESAKVARGVLFAQMVDFTYRLGSRFSGHGLPLGLSRIASAIRPARWRSRGGNGKQNRREWCGRSRPESYKPPGLSTRAASYCSPVLLFRRGSVPSILLVGARGGAP